jgi:lysine-specific demethylase/histidyl-hydroxylase NO66
VFILQVEGSKRWRLYPPVNKANELDRFPSRDFAQSELAAPMLDVVLMPGKRTILVMDIL